MLGPNTDDSFATFGEYKPPALRSQIDDFTAADARSVLDGDVSPEESKRIADLVRKAIRVGKPLPERPHGGHRHRTGWSKTEFDPWFDEGDVIDLVRAIIDNPTNIVPGRKPGRFTVGGTYRGFVGRLHISPIGSGANAWYIASVYLQHLA